MELWRKNMMCSFQSHCEWNDIVVQCKLLKNHLGKHQADITYEWVHGGRSL